MKILVKHPTAIDGKGSWHCVNPLTHEWTDWKRTQKDALAADINTNCMKRPVSTFLKTKFDHNQQIWLVVDSDLIPIPSLEFFKSKYPEYFI